MAPELGVRFPQIPHTNVGTDSQSFYTNGTKAITNQGTLRLCWWQYQVGGTQSRGRLRRSQSLSDGILSS